MKQALTLLAAILLVGQTSAQVVTLVDPEGNIVNGETVIHYGDTDGYQEQDIDVRMDGTIGKNINVRRYEMDVVANTGNYFCWGVCYAEQPAGAIPVWSSLPQHQLYVGAGQSLSNFRAYHVPHGQIGVSTYRFVWYDVDMPSDTTWCDIQFVTTPVGINENVEIVRNMQVFPNPSAGNDVQFNIELNGAMQNTALVIYNMLGERIRTYTLQGTQTRTTVATAKLSSGVYFATLERNGAAIKSQRFVVTK